MHTIASISILIGTIVAVWIFVRKGILERHPIQRSDMEYDMLPSRLKDLESERPYARYQLEERRDDVWMPGMIYACPVERFQNLLTALSLTEDQRLKRVKTTKADMAMVTDTIITTVIP
jgi:hypothetical protein